MKRMTRWPFNQIFFANSFIIPLNLTIIKTFELQLFKIIFLLTLQFLYAVAQVPTLLYIYWKI